MDSVTIWCNAKLPAAAIAALKSVAAGHRLILSEKIVNNLQPGIADPLLGEADIAFGQPDAKQVIDLPRLAFVQLSSAGYARYDRADVREALVARGAVLCNSSSVFVEPCAEHTLSFILAGARQLGAAMTEQFGAKGWPCPQLRQRSRLLRGQSALIVGFGAIGRRLAELLEPLGMNLIGIRRNPRGDEKIPVRSASDLDALLGGADHVVSILPGGEATDGFFDAGKFSRMKPGAMFYNIGRGSTVDQTALRESLLSNHLGGAFLDVTTPEPLPPTNALWTTPNCYITPHTAGGAVDEFDRVVRQFGENLANFLLKKPLRDRVF